MQIKPLFDKILLVLEDDKKENSTGIILPELAKEKPNIAKVVACGNGGRIDGEQTEIIVKVGNKVLFNKYATTEFKIENETFLLIKQADILAILED